MNYISRALQCSPAHNIATAWKVSKIMPKVLSRTAILMLTPICVSAFIVPESINYFVVSFVRYVFASFWAASSNAVQLSEKFKFTFLSSKYFKLYW